MSLLWGADLYLHHKHGVSIWGYRGPTLGRKHSGEKRVAVLGGSTTWGFGLRAGQDFPAQLQRMLKSEGHTINIINLGFNSEGAYSFTQTLADYDYLDFDLVVFYSGYNDLDGPNLYNFRHRTPIFAATGYLPLLPSLTVDKLTVWKRRLMNENEKVIFAPPHLDQKDTSAVRDKLQELSAASADLKSPSSFCSPQNQFYCERISVAAAAALAKGRKVLIVGEPYMIDQHVAQQHELARMISARFGSEPRVQYLDLGRAVDLQDPSLCWDGMHLSEEGNRRIAAALSQPVLEMLQR